MQARNKPMKYLFILAFLGAIIAIGTGTLAMAAGDITDPLVTNVVPADGSTIYANGSSTTYYQYGNTTPLTIKADYSDEVGGSGVNTESIMVHLDIGNMLHDCPVQTDSHVECIATAADLPEGTHPIDVYVTDLDGNETINRTWVTIVVDNAAPTYSSLTPAGGSTILTSQLNSASTNDPSALRFDYDLTDPAPSSGWSPMSHINESVPPSIMGAMISNTSCVKTPTGTNPTHYSCQVNRAKLLKLGDNTLSILLKDKVGNTSSDYSNDSTLKHYTVVDDVDPAVSNISADTTNITAEYTDPAPTGALSTNLTSGINSATAMVHVDGVMIMMGCTATATGISCPTPSGLAAGTHNIEVMVQDNAGNPGMGTVTFDVPLPPTFRNYFWTWYDNKNMNNWVLMANPAGSGKTLDFSLAIEGADQSLAQFALPGEGTGIVPEGRVLTPAIDNLMGGPVKVSSKTGDMAIVSQRSVMGNSLEEVLGTDAEKLSDHFYWTWYDQLSPGMSNWVLIANPSESDTVHAVISLTNQADGTPVISESDIAPGDNWTPTFPGKMGGPVEVKAYKSAGSWPTDKMDVIASQRVLSNYDTAFNEVPGIPAEELSSSYLWTWYDQVSPGAQDWVMLANPGDTAVTYEIKIVGTTMPVTAANPGTIPAHGKVTPAFPGTMDGPVEVTADNPVIASQRVIFGPSFEEVPGYPQGALTNDYHWTWYDQTSTGSANWIMVSNPGGAEVTYEIKIAGQIMPTTSDNPGTIPAHGKVTPAFPGTMDGPVEVKATSGGNVMVSQRVIWNGYFNEVLGTVLQ